ncbi:hypothetical protein AGMMS50268_40130 [Spirochaetia bacterium]|nr:hypothetical protein AGMMS50268_40130 [Spirochaetia bacterium]
MMRNGIIIATPSGIVAKIMRGLLMKVENRIYATDNDLCWTGNERDLWRKIKQVQPRLVFIESNFEGADTRELIKALCKRYELLHVAVFAVGPCNPLTAAQLVTWGAESYLDLHGEEEEFRHGLQIVLNGGSYIPPLVADLTEKMKALPGEERPLSKQELKVFRLTVFGKKKKEIADLLCLSVNTIKTHRMHISRVCGGERMIDYIQYGLNRGLIRVEELAGQEEDYEIDCTD